MTEKIERLEIDPIEKIIYTYIGIDVGSGDASAYYIYDPATDKHHEVSKEKYDSVMKNAHA